MASSRLNICSVHSGNLLPVQPNQYAGCFTMEHCLMQVMAAALVHVYGLSLFALLLKTLLMGIHALGQIISL